MTQRLVDQVDDHFGRSHGVYASALNDQALMLKSMGRYSDAADTYMKALEVCDESALPMLCSVHAEQQINIVVSTVFSDEVCENTSSVKYLD